jgi:hypothetical protein
MSANLMPGAPGIVGIVEVAFGADLTDTDGSGWTWTDVTADVRQNPAVQVKLGRGNEAGSSQPASCTFTLNNPDGAYSLGGQSPNWPYVRRNTPVRVRVNPGDGLGYRVVFQGYADGWSPDWEGQGKIPVVELSASGTLRRLIQGSAPVLSPMSRALPGIAGMVAYWPMEDGRDATYIAPAVGTSSMTWSGTPRLADSDDFPGSEPIPTMGTGWFAADVPTYTAGGAAPGQPLSSNAQQVRFIADFPEAEQTDQAPIMRVFTTGTCARWDLRYNVGGAMDLKGYDRFGTLIVNVGAIAFSVKNTQRRTSLEMYDDGSGNVVYGVNSLTLGTRSFVAIPGSLTFAGTCGLITRVEFNPTGGISGVAIGHLTVQNLINGMRDVYEEFNGFDGEEAVSDPDGRLLRLLAENNIPLVRYAATTETATPADYMGPQRVDDLVTLLRECEAVDQGQLFDGLNAGLTYCTRRSRENRTADLTINAAARELAAPFGPVDDDQRTRNKVRVSRYRGTSSTVEDVTGPLGTASVGVYDTSVTINCSTDGATRLYAGWFVTLGTVEGYRYPTVTVDLLAHPELAPTWLGLRPGMRVDITGLSSVLVGHPSDTASLMIEGKSDRITEGRWTGTLQCSAYAPWQIGLAASTTGDTSALVARADTDGSTVTTTTARGTTTLRVSTASGPLWTTVADDYPLTLDVGGIPVTATACSGTSSPQTFTVAPLTYDRTAGTEVTLSSPTRTGL